MVPPHQINDFLRSCYTKWVPIPLSHRCTIIYERSAGLLFTCSILGGVQNKSSNSTAVTKYWCSLSLCYFFILDFLQLWEILIEFQEWNSIIRKKTTWLNVQSTKYYEIIRTILSEYSYHYSWSIKPFHNLYNVNPPYISANNLMKSYLSYFLMIYLDVFLKWSVHVWELIKWWNLSIFIFY